MRATLIENVFGIGMEYEGGFLEDATFFRPMSLGSLFFYFSANYEANSCLTSMWHRPKQCSTILQAYGKYFYNESCPH